MNVHTVLDYKKLAEDFLKTMLNILYKYQKIEEIVNNIDVTASSNDYASAFIKIKEEIKK